MSEDAVEFRNVKVLGYNSNKNSLRIKTEKGAKLTTFVLTPGWTLARSPNGTVAKVSTEEFMQCTMYFEKWVVLPIEGKSSTLPKILRSLSGDKPIHLLIYGHWVIEARL